MDHYLNNIDQPESNGDTNSRVQFPLDDKTEVEYITDLILKHQHSIKTDNSDEKILLCGSWDEISPCLEYALATKRDKINMTNLIIATKDVDRFIESYFPKQPIHIVDWDETTYEEILIERVKSRSNAFLITMVIDFQPTHRRLGRIRALLEPHGTLIIPYENPDWRAHYPQLMSSFTENRGVLIKLAETVYEEKFRRQICSFLREGQSHSRSFTWYARTSELGQRTR